MKARDLPSWMVNLLRLQRENEDAIGGALLQAALFWWVS